MNLARLITVALALTAIFSWGCSEGATSESAAADASTSELDSAVGSESRSSNAPVDNIEAASRAFQLYYRERVERAVMAHQRFGVFGDVSFGTAIDRAHVAIEGDQIEVVAGPKDNNLIGTATWTTWEAYRIFGGRMLELATLRLFNGLDFYEAVSGHAGMTAREVLPGWTRVVDGRPDSSRHERTRLGLPVVSPWTVDPELEGEMLSLFWPNATYTYRENPEEYYFNFNPVGQMTDYALTHSFDRLPNYLHISNCCSSFKKTPEDKPWAGAFWGNHNSRDNLPDLMWGLLAAMDATMTEGLSPELQSAAERARQAGHRIADLALANGNAFMTVDEWNDYETLVVGGTIRPHGEPENEDLGNMSSCPMAFLMMALTTEGIDSPIPAVPLPVSLEMSILGTEEAASFAVDCPEDSTPGQCVGLGEAYCDYTWENVEALQILGQPWLELAAQWDELDPGRAAELLGGFQNDYDDVVEAMAALIYYGTITDKPSLVSEARSVLGDLTNLMRLFADVVWASSDLEYFERQRYEAAVFDAYGGRDVLTEDLGDFSRAEARITELEETLTMGDTEPWPLLTDEEIKARVEAVVQNEKLGMIVDRYRETYGQEPPIRRAGDGYEARGVPIEKHPWRPVETPRHAHIGNLELLQALPLCRTAPELLDCTWAKLGCAHVDRNGDGAVDATDRPNFAARQACSEVNAWCDGSDLDQTGQVDGVDEAFFEAAKGCHYTPNI